jgi:hypothetical protein
MRVNIMAKQIDVVATFQALTETKQQIKDLELKADALKAQLETVIKAGESKHNIKHIVVPKTSIKYSEYATYLIDKFVAVNRAKTATEAKAKFQTITESHQFKLEVTSE